VQKYLNLENLTTPPNMWWPHDDDIG